MDKDTVQKISKRVYSRFPGMKGSKPKIKQPKSAGGNYVITFNSKVEGPGGHSINRFVRVVADGNGKIIKMSTSK